MTMNYAEGFNPHEHEREFSPEEIHSIGLIEDAIRTKYIAEHTTSLDDDAGPLHKKWETEEGEAFNTVLEDMLRENPSLLKEWERQPEIILAQIQTNMSELAPR
jgi:hypothetical protein